LCLNSPELPKLDLIAQSHRRPVGGGPAEGDLNVKNENKNKFTLVIGFDI
jgi:hypothetical protein